jgi:hypothetical protein
LLFTRRNFASPGNKFTVSRPFFAEGRTKKKKRAREKEIEIDREEGSR